MCFSRGWDILDWSAGLVAATWIDGDIHENTVRQILPTVL